MSTLNELYAQRDKLDKEAEDIHGRADSEQRDLSQDDMIHLDRMKLEKDNLERQIKYKEDRRREKEEAEARRSCVGRDNASLSGPLDESGRHGPSIGHEERSSYGFSGLGEVLQAVARERRGGGSDSRLRELERRTISEGLDSAGGFFVPTPLLTNLFAPQSLGVTPVTTSALRVPMTSDECTIPALVDDNHQTSSPHGISWGVVAEEGALGTPQGLKAHAVKLHALKHVGYFAASNEWLSDAGPAARQMLEQAFIASLEWYIEGLFIRGTGTKQPLGVLNAPGTVTVDKEPLQAADTITLENILEMKCSLITGGWSRAIWLANKRAWKQIAKLTVVGGVAAVYVGLFPGSIAGAPGDTISGRPLYVNEHCSALGDAGDLILIDPLAYVLGWRSGITIDLSPHVLFANDQTAFRVSARFDARPRRAGKLTERDGTEAGDAVILEARA